MHQHMRYALRVLLRNPGFSAVAILTLALGIGANTAIFTVANAVLLRPLPYSQPDRIAVLAGATFDAAGGWGRLSLPFFRNIEGHNRSYSSVAACIYDSFNMTGRGDPEQLSAVRVTWRFFDTLGVQPFIGRSFTEQEDQPGGKPVVLLSYKLATRIFETPAKALGRNLTLDGQDYTIIGVLNPRFVFGLFGGEADVWAPRVFDMNSITRTRVELGGAYFNLLGRLRPGVSMQQAEAELRVLYQQYRGESPTNFDASENLTMRVGILQDELVHNIRPTLLILSGAVGLLLLIACANVASLLLSRAVGRKKEFSIRTALGASRRALIGQLLTESILLALISGALGIAIAYAGTRLLPSFDEQGLRLGELHVDLTMIGFTLAVSVLSGVIFGLAPSLHLSSVTTNLRTRDRSQGRARSVLVVIQVALSVILLVGSGLLIRSFIHLRNAPPGFDPENLLTMRLNLPPARYQNAAKSIEFYNSAIQHIQSIPGVEAVTISTAIPTNATHATPMLFDGQPAVPLGQRPLADIQQITPDYTKVMRVPVKAGRIFTDHDDAAAPKVALVNETTVHRFWPNQNPIGKRVWIGTMKTPVEVVGVLGDTKNNGTVVATEPEVFLPLPQLVSPYVCLTVRAAHIQASEVKSQLAAADPNQPVTGVMTMETFLESQSQQSRFTMVLLTVFSLVAFTLAAIGIYGVIAYSVAQRTQELGVRIALGATRADILSLVVASGLTLTLVGIAIGLVTSLAATRLMSTLLFETSAKDPTTFLTSAALFITVALVASYVPARRATRIDPTIALRAE
jgi:putative ABC transport system permease protein